MQQKPLLNIRQRCDAIYTGLGDPDPYTGMYSRYAYDVVNQQSLVLGTTYYWRVDEVNTLPERMMSGRVTFGALRFLITPLSTDLINIHQRAHQEQLFSEALGSMVMSASAITDAISESARPDSTSGSYAQNSSDTRTATH